MVERILNCKETAQILGISKATLYRLTHQKQLRKIQISPKRVGWPESELERFIEKRLHQTQT